MECRRRRIVIVRHGERLDRLFPYTATNEWVNECFSDDHTYIKHNLNMPDELPKREGSPRSFHNDCPLTQIGLYQATLTGKGLLDDKILRDGFQIYVSPALRCVQTATALLEGMKEPKDLKIEPGLFECTEFYGNCMPKFMTDEEFTENGYKLDASYTPFKCRDDFKPEHFHEFYDRSYQIIQHLINTTAINKDLLLVGHGGSWDALTRQLLGGSNPKDKKEELDILRQTPYCGAAVVEENAQGSWKMISTPRITLRHNHAFDFDASKISQAWSGAGQDVKLLECKIKVLLDD